MLKNIGKAISGMSGRSMVGVGVGAFGLGMANTVGPEARDAAFDAVLGTPDADMYFTGRKMDTRFLLGEAFGGITGGVLKATAPGDTLMVHTGYMPGEKAVRTGMVGGAIGGATIGGAAVGMLSGGSPMARLAKGTVGAAIGGSFGGTMGGSAPFIAAGAYAANNREFFAQSPYGRASSANAELSAVGDIVLGMHNSRRGY